MQSPKKRLVAAALAGLSCLLVIAAIFLAPISNARRQTVQPAQTTTTTRPRADKSLMLTIAQRGQPRPFDDPIVSNTVGGNAGNIGAYESHNLQAPTLGNYPNGSIPLSTNTTVTPDAAPTNTVKMTVSTSTDFKGKLEGYPATGVVRVTDAHPAGTYTVTVTAFNSVGATTKKTFPLTVTTPFICTPVTFAAASNFSVGTRPFLVAMGDFNGDHKEDLAVANNSSNNVSILLGDGAGGFGVATNFSVPADASSVAVGDFNGDGKQDLAVTDDSSNAVSGNVSILLGDGAGSFSAPTNFAVDEPSSVAVGDFNGDGKQDLAVANAPPNNNVSILLGDGAGGFGTATNFSVGNDPNSVSVGDFNADGKQDLAFANEFSNDVSILLGDGTGGFGIATNFVVGTHPVAVTLGDFNGDGKQDLAVANADSGDVSIVLGNGAGGFGAATNFAAGFTPLSVAVGDFNGDGRQDIAVADGTAIINTPYKVLVLIGNGAGGFGAATNFNVGTRPQSVVVGDFNGDGEQDLAVANLDSNNVSILSRYCPCPSPFTVNDIGDASDVTPGDYVCATAGGVCTLRAAIEEANALSSCSGTVSIQFGVSTPNTINLSSALPDINRNVDFNGPGANLLTVMRSAAGGTSNFRIFTISSGSTVRISGLTISNGRTLDSTSSNPSEDGGGIFNSGTLNLDGVIVSGNQSGNGFGSQPDGGRGGGIFNLGSLSVTNSSAVGNKTGTGEHRGGYGGGIYNLGTLTLTNSAVNSNETGSGVWYAGYGGGIFNAATLTLTKSTVSGNHIASGDFFASGGGVYNANALIVTDSTISNNASGGGGGGIASSGQGMTLTNSTINNNHVTLGPGGGISSYNNNKTTIVNCSIFNNASSQGGGLALEGIDAATVINSTISGNSSDGNGGGILVSSTARLASLTIVNNRSGTNDNGGGQGGGIFQYNGACIIGNSIVAGNFRGSSPGTTADDIAGTLDPNSPFNLIGTGGSGGLTDGTNGNHVGVANPGLGPLANNGGSTLTHALIVGSPAIDAGSNSLIINPPFTGPPFTDQRGFKRIADGDGNASATVDIGAYELQGVLILDAAIPPACRTSGGQQIRFVGSFPNLASVLIGPTSVPWFYTNGPADTSSITVTTPAHAVGAASVQVIETSSFAYPKPNAFAYLPTVFTDDTIVVGQTTAKAQHIIELRQAVDALRAVAGLSGAPWTDPALAPGGLIKATHIIELRMYLDDAATRLGYSTSPYTDPGLTSGFMIKRIHIEELRQRLRAIAG